MIEIFTIGGYTEVGKNMTAIKYNNEIVIVDMGFFLPKLISFEEEGGDRRNLTEKGLIKLGVFPDDTLISSLKDNVKAIVLGHCHLDHIGAVPFLAPKYNCSIYGTHYTIEVLKTMMDDDKMRIKNPLVAMNTGVMKKVSDHIEIELINVTHSTLQTAMVAIHTPEGIIIYANDFKLDSHPVIGKKPDFDRLKKLGDSGFVKALILDSLYAGDDRKTPSEKVAREMLKDVMFGTENTGNAIIATSFASHIARIKSMVEFGEKLDRKVVILGRSMMKYIGSAEKIDLVDFSSRSEIVGYGNKVKKRLGQIQKDGKSKYLIICTGGQGENGAILTRIANNQLNFKFDYEDHVIFSNKTIPVPANIEARKNLEKNLKNQKVRIFKDIHVSGHAGREDLRDLVKMIKPLNIIPAHGDSAMLNHMVDLAEEMGYVKGKNVHFCSNGSRVFLK
ncbi:MAG: RNase J family beta-CASP ribonuclease [Candidatus Nanoarchaeia archaeon]|nr:RNase J family beta-CASP ribonuclease [Candidatus Nanoarchaeia archaeon]